MATDTILITGASGFIGSALARALQQDGFRVFALDRVDPQSPFYYDSERNTVRLDEETPLRAVINLAGANIADGRWSPQRKETIWNSRVELTRALSEALARLPQKPEVLLSAPAIGYYGNQCNTATDEFGNPGTDFLADLSVAWESATQPASDAGIRVVWMRFGLVLAAHGGVLKKLVGDKRELILRLLGTYQESLSSGYEKLVDAYESNDWETIHSTAHTLKSSSRSVGALPLGELFASLEEAGGQSNVALVASGMARLAEAVDAVHAELQPWLNDSSHGNSDLQGSPEELTV